MFLGIVMCTLANVGINLGTNIIKLAFNKRQNEIESRLEAAKLHTVTTEEDFSDLGVNGKHGGSFAGGKNARNSLVLNPLSEEKEDTRETVGSKVAPIYKWRSWQIGFIIFKTSNVINFVSLGFGKQSVLASLSSVQFVSNLFFCYFVLHERLGLNDILGTTSIVIGVVICIVANSSGGSGVYTVDELISLMKEKSYLIYIGTIGCLAVMAYMTFTGNFYLFKLNMGDKSKKKEGEGDAGSEVKYRTNSVGMVPVNQAQDDPSLDNIKVEKLGGIRMDTLRPLCFATYVSLAVRTLYSLSLTPPRD